MQAKAAVVAAIVAAAIGGAVGLGPAVVGAEPGTAGHGSKVVERETGRELHVGDVVASGRSTGKDADGMNRCDLVSATNVDTAVDPANDVKVTFAVTEDCRVVIQSITSAKPSGEAPRRGELKRDGKTEATR